MPADDHVPALVELMYRADWTSQSLALEVREFDDYAARARAFAPRPPWQPESGPAAARASRRPPPDLRRDPDPDDDDPDDEIYEADEPHQNQRERAYRLLIAPGGRFRADDSDGQFAGSAGPEGPESPEGSAGLPGWPRHDMLPPCLSLLMPGWLPARFELELAGPALVAGRPAHRLIGRARPVAARLRSRAGGRYHLTPAPHQLAGLNLRGIDRIDVALDAELGILLRCELMHRGQLISRSEITALTAEPADAAAAGSFTAPPEADEELGGTPFTGPGWDRAKSAANAGATALNFVIRHAPHRDPPAGARAGAPPDFPATAENAGWPGPPGPAEPVSGPIIRLLYEAGLRHTAFAAELRTWADATRSADAIRAAAGKTTLPGVTKLGETMSERATTWQGRDAISVGLPDKYRIDYIDGGTQARKVRSEVCDGQQRWRRFADHVSVGAALPLPDSVARLADPAWLLEWKLTGGTEITEGGRRAYLIRVRPAGPAPGGAPAHLAKFIDTVTEVVLDADSGVVLRLLQEQGGRPSLQQVLTGLTTRPQASAAEFRLEVPPGSRVRQDSGTMFDEAELSAPAQTAVRLTVSTLKTAARVGGFLESLREQRKRPGPR
jgi:hypothetical protein